MGPALLHKVLHVPFWQLILLWGLTDCFSWSQRLCCSLSGGGLWWSWAFFSFLLVMMIIYYFLSFSFVERFFVQETEQRLDSHFRIVRYGVSTTKEVNVFHRLSGINRPEWCHSPRLWIQVVWPFMARCTLCSVNCQRERTQIRSI